MTNGSERQCSLEGPAAGNIAGVQILSLAPAADGFLLVRAIAHADDGKALWVHRSIPQSDSATAGVCAMYVGNGKPTECRQCKAGLVATATQFERWDADDRVFVGELACEACGAHFLYARKPTDDEGVSVAKRAAKKQTTGRGKGKRVAKNGADAETHRVTTFGKGGNLPESSTAVAPAKAVEEPGAIELPDDAEAALREIALLNERVMGAHLAFKDAAEVAKHKREKWQELAEELQALIRRLTHKPDLPLFDAGQREADQGRLIAAVETAAQQDSNVPEAPASEAQGETSGADAAIEASTETIEVPAGAGAVETDPQAPGIAPADTVVF